MIISKKFIEYYKETSPENLDIKIHILKWDIQRDYYSPQSIFILKEKLRILENIRDKKNIEEKFSFKIFGFVITKI